MNLQKMLEAEAQLHTLDPKKWVFQMGPVSSHGSDNVTLVISHEDLYIDNEYINIGNFYVHDCNGRLPKQVRSFLKSIYRSDTSWNVTRKAMKKAGFQEKFLGYPTVEPTVRALLENLLGWNRDFVRLTEAEYAYVFNNDYTVTDNDYIVTNKVTKKVNFNLVAPEKRNIHFLDQYLLDQWLDDNYEDPSEAKGQWDKLSQTVTQDERIVRVYQNKVWLIIISIIENKENIVLDQIIVID